MFLRKIRNFGASRIFELKSFESMTHCHYSVCVLCPMRAAKLHLVSQRFAYSSPKRGQSLKIISHVNTYWPFVPSTSKCKMVITLNRFFDLWSVKSTAKRIFYVTIKLVSNLVKLKQKQIYSVRYHTKLSGSIRHLWQTKLCQWVIDSNYFTVKFHKISKCRIFRVNKNSQSKITDVFIYAFS